MMGSAEPFAEIAQPGRRIGHRVEWHATIGSTNDRARELLDRPDGEGTAVVAEEQMSGRGRRGRAWMSPPGLNLMVSIGLRPRLSAAQAWMLGPAAALAARAACSDVVDVALKWPNDLVAADGRKIGGMLVETALHDEALTVAVVGIGINVNWRVSDMPAQLAATATSLSELAGRPIDRAALLARLLDAMDVELAAIEADTSPLPRYRAACVTIGRAVTVDVGGRIVSGRAVDLDPGGGLVLDTVDGPVTITTGEVVSARPEAGS
jgi:BirA family transcriptional regulator, biotin operon repressor / biotin---[acetyl-CoA-carboxylase] ligase